MVFSSLPFIFLFLPIFMIIYAFIPSRYRNHLLFIGSIGFYAFGTLKNPLYILLIIASIAVNFGLGIAIDRKEKYRKQWLLLGLFYNFAWLFLFKYADFFFSGLNLLTSLILPQTKFVFPTLNLLLPIGISFYTFQAVSYLIDVYRKNIAAETSFINLGTYICMFPQLIAGPIVTYSSVSEQLKSRLFNKNNVIEGGKSFILGLGLKVLLANQIGNLWSDIAAVGFESISTPLAWMGALSFTFQIYFDFYGYSLMAIGLGKMLGFNLPKNFCHPYLSLSMTEFWRRWHITLGSWFRAYVYIPLGGSREEKARTILNLSVVWLLTGIWHGASLNFMLWGFSLFLLIAIEKLGLKRFLDKHRVIGHIYMMFCIPLSWMIFAITDFSQMKIYFSRLFPILQASQGLFQNDFIKYGKTYGIILIICLLFCTKLPQTIYKKIKSNTLCGILFLAAFWGSVYCLFIGLNDPFLYFRF